MPTVSRGAWRPTASGGGGTRPRPAGCPTPCPAPPVAATRPSSTSAWHHRVCRRHRRRVEMVGRGHGQLAARPRAPRRRWRRHGPAPRRRGTTGCAAAAVTGPAEPPSGCATAGDRSPLIASVQQAEAAARRSHRARLQTERAARRGEVDPDALLDQRIRGELDTGALTSRHGQDAVGRCGKRMHGPTGSLHSVTVFALVITMLLALGMLVLCALHVVVVSVVSDAISATDRQNSAVCPSPSAPPSSSPSCMA